MQKFSVGKFPIREWRHFTKLDWRHFTKLDWRQCGKNLHRKIPIGESGATSKTGLALGFCGDSFSASPWGGELGVGNNLIFPSLSIGLLFIIFQKRVFGRNFPAYFLIIALEKKMGGV